MVGDGLEYITGWLVYKFRSQYPHLEKTSDEDHDYYFRLPSWIEELSLRGLRRPTDEFLNEMRRVNRILGRLLEINTAKIEPASVNLVILMFAFEQRQNI